MRRRGTTNRNVRGSSYDRRSRKLFLLQGASSVPCFRCSTPLTFETLTVDRILPGVDGGTYRRSNIRPACAACNSETGATTRCSTAQALVRRFRQAARYVRFAQQLPRGSVNLGRLSDALTAMTHVRDRLTAAGLVDLRALLTAEHVARWQRAVDTARGLTNAIRRHLRRYGDTAVRPRPPAAGTSSS